MRQPYEIVIHGHLTSQWFVMFEGMEVTNLQGGDSCITVSLADQSALYGLLMLLRDLGITLISINVGKPKEET